jgi:hypothetical protein
MSDNGKAKHPEERPENYPANLLLAELEEVNRCISVNEQTVRSASEGIRTLRFRRHLLLGTLIKIGYDIGEEMRVEYEAELFAKGEKC